MGRWKRVEGGEEADGKPSTLSARATLRLLIETVTSKMVQRPAPCLLSVAVGRSLTEVG